MNELSEKRPYDHVLQHAAEQMARVSPLPDLALAAQEAGGEGADVAPAAALEAADLAEADRPPGGDPPGLVEVESAGAHGCSFLGRMGGVRGRW